MWDFNAEAVVSHTIFLMLPLSIIFRPKYCQRAFGLYDEGRADSSERMTPDMTIQLVGWILLIVGCCLPLLSLLRYSR